MQLPHGPISAEDRLAAQRHYYWMLKLLNVDVEDEELLETPRRYVDSLIEYMSQEAWAFTTFPIDASTVKGGQGDFGMIVMRNIPFRSLCAHHVSPFMGKAHVAYVPHLTLAGLSKLARTVESMAKGLNVQEAIGSNVADFLMKELKPWGVMVVLEAEHTCYTLRGAKAHGSSAITSAVRGVFFDDSKARSEAMQLFRGI